MMTWLFLGHDADIVKKAQTVFVWLEWWKWRISLLDDSDIDLDYVRTFSSSESDSADLDGEDSQSLSNVWLKHICA